MEWRGQEYAEPLQYAKNKGLAKASSSRLFISISVIQDHVESIGKANTIKRG